MYCSGCGTALTPGAAACPQCGRPAPAPVPLIAPPMAEIEFQIDRYRSSLKALSIAWYVYGGLSLLMGLAKLTFLRDV